MRAYVLAMMAAWPCVASAAPVWGADQPDADPPLGPVPAATLTICPDRGEQGHRKCAGFPWYPYNQADKDDHLVGPNYVAYIEPGTYQVPGFRVREAGECWYVGRGRTPADTVIHVTSLVQGKAAMLIESPCHFVNMTIEGGDLNQNPPSRFGEGGVAGAYLAGLPAAAAGKATLVTFDDMIFQDSNNGVFSPNARDDENQKTLQIVIRRSRFRRNSVLGMGGSHDVYVGARWLSVIDSVFELNIDSDDLKSRGGYAYVARSWIGAWAGRCIDRPNGGTTILVENTCVLWPAKPEAQRGIDAGQSGNHLYAFGEDQGGGASGKSDLRATGAPDVWTDTGSTIWTGTPGAKRSGHCAQVMSVAGLTMNFRDPRQLWGDAGACIAATAPYGAAAGPGTVVGLALAPSGATSPMPMAPKETGRRE